MLHVLMSTLVCSGLPKAFLYDCLGIFMVFPCHACTLYMYMYMKMAALALRVCFMFSCHARTEYMYVQSVHIHVHVYRSE